MRIARLASITSSVVPLALPVGLVGAQARSAATAISLSAVVPPRVVIDAGPGGAEPPALDLGDADRRSAPVTGGRSALAAIRIDGTVELTRHVRFANARASRVDVQLAPGPGAVATGVRAWVRTEGGGFVPLVPGARVTISRAPDRRTPAPGLVVFRLRPDGPATSHPLELPVTYRLIHGDGETASGWSVTELLRVDGSPEP